MKKALFLELILVIILCLSIVGYSYAGMLIIKMNDGNIITLETSKITSMTFSEGIQSGGYGDFGLMLSGNWTSTEGGSMTIQQYGTDFRSNYPVKNGRIMGKLSGNIVEGYWIQDSSGRRCSYPIDNSYYWGKIRFNFTSQSYSGYWGYCDETPNNPWSGTKK